MESYHVLIVEDDKEILEGIGIYLRNQGYTVFQAENGKKGLEIIQDETIHLAIVDIMMPVMDGITMTMKLRERFDFPVIMLSAKSEEIDKVTGLNIGADDYVTKPFTPMELMARVNSHLRRYSRYLKAVDSKEEKEPENYYAVGGLELNEDTVEVSVDG
ncbi:MAG TPA: DNA-binding response regulator, partial [Lachnoclostridium phytofermentans]